jgi:hypothetical protein
MERTRKKNEIQAKTSRGGMVESLKNSYFCPIYGAA